MRFQHTARFLQQLNQAAVFVRFQDSSWRNEPTDSAEADYFGEVISISFPNASAQDADGVDLYATFYLRLFKLDEKEFYEKASYQPFEADFKTIEEAIAAINQYVRSRPFKILWHGERRFGLLDPEGFDYCGEHISLADAKRTCHNNYTR